MEISPVVCWLVAGLLLVGVDMLLGTFYLLVMGLAAGCGLGRLVGRLAVFRLCCRYHRGQSDRAAFS